jgi:hypothetical protein
MTIPVGFTITLIVVKQLRARNQSTQQIQESSALAHAV